MRAVLHVPEGSHDVCRRHAVWGRFGRWNLSGSKEEAPVQCAAQGLLHGGTVNGRYRTATIFTGVRSPMRTKYTPAAGNGRVRVAADAVPL